MAVVAAYVVPHPPLIIPGVGAGREAEIGATADSYRRVAREIGQLAPETIVLFTPHATMYADYIHIAPGAEAEGDFSRFGCAQSLRAVYDTQLVDALDQRCHRSGFPGGTQGEQSPALDHGALVPLHFLQEHTAAKLVRISPSGLSREEHYRFGMLLEETVRQLDRRVVVIASGDLSHKLTEDGPYGFAPEGPQLDAAITEVLRTGGFGELFRLPDSLCERGAECGLMSIIMLAGTLDRRAVEATLLSYEGPFGVGYAVASFLPGGPEPRRSFLQHALGEYARNLARIRDGESPPVRLARRTLEGFVRTGRMPDLPDDLPEEFLAGRAGTFVSIKLHGQLRGCIGTISPAEPNIAREIMQNAVSAGVRDPRFRPVTEAELAGLVYHVDILSPPEPAACPEELDADRYGVIVTSGVRRGLLLPRLDGVDTVEEQIRIALKKAEIDPNERYELQRFEVVRYQ